LQKKFQFHVGYYDHLHPDPSINFQMNRWISFLGISALEELQGIAPRLLDYPSYCREFLALAEKALSERRSLHAAYYFRSAEFFMRQNDPRMNPTRQKFLNLLWEGSGVKEIDRLGIPYKDGNLTGLLAAYYFPHDRSKSTIVIHGGHDSYIEELFPVIMFIRDLGYTVICFEGPGQGAALHGSGLFLTHEWHKPVGAILDYFKLEDVTLLGISMGGCFALRAAALEPRIKRVVAYDVFFDWLGTTYEKLRPVAPLLNLMLDCGASGPFNLFLAGIMKKSPLFDWAMHQARLVLGVSTSYDVFQKSRPYTTRDISPLIKQDVLLMAGSEDNLIPLHHFYQQIKALKNARSVTARLFTRPEQAQNHCQVGNLRLAVDCITNWIDFTHQHAM
jgi:pimeloyl-ACP methyl ester carboxylesterase